MPGFCFDVTLHRPPGARTLQSHLQAGAAAINGPTFSLAYDDSSKPGRITQLGKPMPPGAEFVGKAASKNAKKRANKKAKSGGEGGLDGEQDEVEQLGESSGNAAVQAVTEQVRLVDRCVVYSRTPQLLVVA